MRWGGWRVGGEGGEAGVPFGHHQPTGTGPAPQAGMERSAIRAPVKARNLCGGSPHRRRSRTSKPKVTASPRGGVGSNRRRTVGLQDDEPDSAGCDWRACGFMAKPGIVMHAEVTVKAMHEAHQVVEGGTTGRLREISGETCGGVRRRRSQSPRSTEAGVKPATGAGSKTAPREGGQEERWDRTTQTQRQRPRQCRQWRLDGRQTPRPTGPGWKRACGRRPCWRRSNRASKEDAGTA